jgi:hypothetical protein
MITWGWVVRLRSESERALSVGAIVSGRQQPPATAASSTPLVRSRCPAAANVSNGASMQYCVDDAARGSLLQADAATKQIDDKYCKQAEERELKRDEALILSHLANPAGS